MMDVGLPPRSLAPETKAAATSTNCISGVTRSLVGRTVAEVERALILDTLDHCRGNRTQAAGMLGISLRTLRNKLGEYVAVGLAVPEPRQARAASS
jgi:two-component system, response regulator FlrC